MDKQQRLEVLLAYLKKQTGATDIKVQQFKQLTGGAVQENHLLEVELEGGTMPGPHRWVVRCDAPASLSVSLSRKQEFEVLRTVAAAGVTVPQPYFLCEDTSVLGSQFYVMAFAPGMAGGRELAKDQTLSDAERKQLTYNLGQQIARLHKIRYDPQILPFLSKPTPSPAQQRIAELQALSAKLSQPQPVLELGLKLLQQFQPAQEPTVLSHGDFRSGNYLVHEGQLSALLDWEFTSWSSPYDDLGWMCCRCWRFGHPEREAGGVGDKADLYAGYEAESGHAVDDKLVLYYAVLGTLRWLAIAFEQAQRHLSGQQESLELALTGRMTAEIQQDALEQMQQLYQAYTGQTFAVAEVPVAYEPQDTAVQDQLNRYYQEQPDATNLLKTARNVLLKEILAELPPSQTMNALMIANAMGIAYREIEGSKRHYLQQQDQLLEAFYAEQQWPRREGVVAVQQLTEDIKQAAFDDPLLGKVYQILVQLTALKLQINNPKRLS